MLTPLTRRFPLLALGIVLLLVVPAVASSSLRGSSADAKVLRVGTSFYISSLNPFVGIETNDSMAYSMVYPQLVQYVPGPRIGSDWASSWKRGNGGLTWTFRLKKGKWSDGTPLTSADAVWTINTVLKYKAGPTSYVASSYEGIKGASAPDPQTLVISYSRPIAPALSNLSQTYILPKHVWSTKLGKNGKGLREFRPQENLPNVSGGPYTVTQYQQKGTTAFKPNPNFYGPKSKSAGVAFTYYTNATSLVVDMQRGKLEFIDSLPYGAADAANRKPGTEVTFGAGSQVTNLGFNSNPKKSKNRELLSPRLKEAFEYAIPRQQIVDVMFSGHVEAVGEHPFSGLEGGGLAQPRGQAPALQRREGEQDPRLARLRARVGRAQSRPRHSREARAIGARDELQRHRAEGSRLQRRSPVRHPRDRVQEDRCRAQSEAGR